MSGVRVRLRHRESSDGITEVLIDKIDEEKKDKIMNYLETMNLKPECNRQELEVALDISTNMSKQVCDKIVSFMQTIGVDEVSVSSVQFDERKPEIDESDTASGVDFTPVNSSEVRVLASRIEKGEESEFELVMCSPEEDVGPSLSKNLIPTIERRCGTLDGPKVRSLSVKDSNWWSNKSSKLCSFLRKMRKRGKGCKTASKEVLPKRNASQPAQNTIWVRDNVLLRRNSSAEKRDDKKGNDRKKFMRSLKKRRGIPKKRKNENFVHKKVMNGNSIIGTKNRVKKLFLEVYTQTNNNKKYTNTHYKTQDRRKARVKTLSDEQTTSTGCSRCVVDCVPRIQPRYIAPAAGPYGNMPFYMNQTSLRQPFFYVMPSNTMYHQQRKFTTSQIQRGFKEEGWKTYTTSTTTNTSYTECSRMARERMRKERVGPYTDRRWRGASREQHGPRRRVSPSPQEKPQPTKVASSNPDTEILQSYPNPRHARSENGYYTKALSPIKLPFEKTLAEIHEKLEEIKMTQKEPMKKDASVECCDFEVKEKVITVDVGIVCSQVIDAAVQYTEEVSDTTRKQNENDERSDNSRKDNSSDSSQNIGHELRKDDVAPRNYEFCNRKTGNVLQKGKPRRSRYQGRFRDTEIRGNPSLYRLGENYSYEQSDPEFDFGFNPWGSEVKFDLPSLEDNVNIEKNKPQKTRCSKLCTIFTGKKKQLKQKLMQQKQDLLDMKSILNAIQQGIATEYVSETDDLEEEEDSGEKDGEAAACNPRGEPADIEYGEKGDLQFFISRPKNSKKSVTFRSPLTD